jgi:hypothetical protein
MYGFRAYEELAKAHGLRTFFLSQTPSNYNKHIHMETIADSRQGVIFQLRGLNNFPPQ